MKKLRHYQNQRRNERNIEKVAGVTQVYASRPNKCLKSENTLKQFLYIFTPKYLEDNWKIDKLFKNSKMCLIPIKAEGGLVSFLHVKLV